MNTQDLPTDVCPEFLAYKKLVEEQGLIIEKLRAEADKKDAEIEGLRELSNTFKELYLQSYQV